MESMEEDRNRYDRRLSLVMANPAIRNQGMNNVDMASKIEIQNLRQELAAAQSAVCVIKSSTECYRRTTGGSTQGIEG